MSLRDGTIAIVDVGAGTTTASFNVATLLGVPAGAATPLTPLHAAYFGAAGDTPQPGLLLPVRVGARVQVVAIGKEGGAADAELLWTVTLPFAEAPVELMTTITAAAGGGGVKLLISGNSSVVALA